MSPKITVLTATHNRPDLLYRAIISVQNQTIQEYEHIIVGDRCKISEKVVKSFNDSRLKYFFNSEEIHNQGALGWNIGLDNMTSEYVTYLCDDNIFLPNHLEIMYNNIQTMDVVYAGFYHIYIGAGDRSIKKQLERNMYDITSSDIFSGEGLDMISLCHKRYINNEIIYWKPICQLPGYYGEDKWYMEQLRRITQKIKVIKNVTSIYYARDACHNLDNDYHQRVNNLSDNQLFVYPEYTNKEYIMSHE